MKHVGPGSSIGASSGSTNSSMGQTVLLNVLYNIPKKLFRPSADLRTEALRNVYDMEISNIKLLRAWKL